MPYRWVVDQQHPQGYSVAMAPAEEAQYQADQAAGAAAATNGAAQIANWQAMANSLKSHMQEALDLAGALETNTATAVQQRQAIALCLRGTVRLTRLTLELLDTAA